MSKRPTQKQKIEMYEALLHDIQMFANVAMDPEIVGDLISNICAWSYAHRCGNGELTDRQQQAIITRNFWKLRNHRPSYYERKQINRDEFKEQSEGTD